MRPLAHHAGEETLSTLLLLGGAWLSVLVAYSRERLAAARARLTGEKAGQHRASGEMHQDINRGVGGGGGGRP
jgi:hypothetical protein